MLTSKAGHVNQSLWQWSCRCNNGKYLWTAVPHVLEHRRMSLKGPASLRAALPCFSENKRPLNRNSLNNSGGTCATDIYLPVPLTSAEPSLNVMRRQPRCHFPIFFEGRNARVRAVKILQISTLGLDTVQFCRSLAWTLPIWGLTDRCIHLRPQFLPSGFAHFFIPS